MEILYSLKNYIAKIILNNPEKGNVVNITNLKLLHSYIKEANNDKNCRVILIEGSDGVFSRGMDFEFLLKTKDISKEISENFSLPYIEAVMSIRNSKKPVIAGINGDVLAGGMGIALACDIVLSTNESFFGLSEVLFGLIPAYVFPFLLERVPLKKARFMILSSKKFNSKEAYQMGIIDDVFEKKDYNKKLKEYIQRILYSSPDALEIVKTYSDMIYNKNIEDSVKLAGAQLTELLNNKENINAIKSFIEGDRMPWVVKYKRH